MVFAVWPHYGNLFMGYVEVQGSRVTVRGTTSQRVRVHSVVTLASCLGTITSPIALLHVDLEPSPNEPYRRLLMSAGEGGRAEGNGDAARRMPHVATQNVFVPIRHPSLTIRCLHVHHKLQILVEDNRSRAGLSVQVSSLLWVWKPREISGQEGCSCGGLQWRRDAVAGGCGVACQKMPKSFRRGFVEVGVLALANASAATPCSRAVGAAPRSRATSPRSTYTRGASVV